MTVRRLTLWPRLQQSKSRSYIETVDPNRALTNQPMSSSTEHALVIKMGNFECNLRSLKQQWSLLKVGLVTWTSWARSAASYAHTIKTWATVSIDRVVSLPDKREAAQETRSCETRLVIDRQRHDSCLSFGLDCRRQGPCRGYQCIFHRSKVWSD